MTMRRVEKPEARMEHWRVIRTSTASFHLVGVAFGHGRFIDGGIILTSDLVDLYDGAGGGTRVETLNTIYSLGQQWVGAMPDAYCMLADDMLGDDWWPIHLEERPLQ